MIISAHEATSTRDCKTVGCPGVAEAKLGPYAGLCRTCKASAQTKMSAQRRQQARRPRKQPGTHAVRRSADAHSYSARLERLQRAAEKLDKIKPELQAALDEWNEARRELANGGSA